MDRSKVIRLLTVSRTVDSSGTQVDAITKTRKVFCQVSSIGMKEAYLAMGVNRNPEMKVTMREAGDYHGEKYAMVDDDYYVVMRTYKSGSGIELTLERTRDLEGLV